MRNRIKTIAVAALVAALTVAGLAVAENDGSGKDSRAPGPPPGGPAFMGGPGGQALTYSETHLRRAGEDVVVRVDKGKVLAADEDSIEIERNDGETVEVAVDGDTKVMAGPRKRGSSVADIAAGKQAIVVREDGDAAAEAIAVVPKNPPKRGPGHGFGPPPGDLPGPPAGDGEQG